MNKARITDIHSVIRAKIYTDLIRSLKRVVNLPVLP